MPLRLGDITCRNRNPYKLQPIPFTDVKGFFQFSRGYPRTLADPDPHVRTPNLDRLASTGAVFPRAHAGGTECKASRTVFWNGIFNQHLLNAGFKRNGSFGTTDPCDPGDPSRFSGIGCYLHHLGNCPEGNCPTRYEAYIWGKEDISQTNDEDFAPHPVESGGSLGQVSSLCDSACQQDIIAGRFDNQPSSMILQVTNIFDRIGNELVDDDALTRPFFVWYAPNFPHPTGSAPQEFLNLYTGLPDDNPEFARTTLARMTEFDAGVGAVVNQLQRRCVCNAAGEQAPVYDNTVLVFINDNGNRVNLPNSKRRPTENGERSPIIINEPGLRPRYSGPNPQAAPKPVLDYASGVDLLATIVSYARESPASAPPPADSCGGLGIPKTCAGGPNQSLPCQSDSECPGAGAKCAGKPSCIGGTNASQPCTSDAGCPGGSCLQKVEFGYPTLRNLCPAARNTRVPGRARARDAYMSHWAKDVLRPTRLFTLLTAPEQLGVCSGDNASRTKYGHVRPCHADTQCPCRPELALGPSCPLGHDVCHMFPGRCAGDPNVRCTGDGDCSGLGGLCYKGGRCTNRPETACTVDGDCAVGLCIKPLYCKRNQDLPCTSNLECGADDGCEKLGRCDNFPDDGCVVDDDCRKNPDGTKGPCNTSARCSNSGDSCVSGGNECAATSLCRPNGGHNECYNDSKGEFAEFKGKRCSTERDCVPAGVCQPVVLKVEMTPPRPGQPICSCNDITAIRDPNWDPDAGFDLKRPDPRNRRPQDAYIDQGLEKEFKDCLWKFSRTARDSNGVWFSEPDACPLTCPLVDDCHFDNASPFG